MFSIRMPSCSSPRACTSTFSPPPGTGRTSSETLVSASAWSRSEMTRPVTAFPERPASGESLGPKTMDSVGGSTCPGSSGASTSGEAIVSAIPAAAAPAMETMSPATARSMTTRSMPRRLRMRVMAASLTPPPRPSTRTRSPTATVPAAMRPAAGWVVGRWGAAR